jgi:hypothetical protein
VLVSGPRPEDHLTDDIHIEDGQIELGRTGKRHRLPNMAGFCSDGVAQVLERSDHHHPDDRVVLDDENLQRPDSHENATPELRQLPILRTKANELAGAAITVQRR